VNFDAFVIKLTSTYLTLYLSEFMTSLTNSIFLYSITNCKFFYLIYILNKSLISLTISDN